MLSLESNRWADLTHAYGRASDIPPLLARLRELPQTDGDAEPWFSLWSALAHQGDVFPASFAAVPHVVDVLASSPTQAGPSFFHFPAWVEICRFKQLVDVPPDLKGPYVESLARLPGLVAEASTKHWDAEFLVCAISAVAVAKGQHSIAEAVLELSSAEIAEKFLEWKVDQ